VSGKGNALFYVTVEAEFDFVSSIDGSKHTVTMFGEAMDSGDKATNKAMSAAYKYAMFQAFCIPTEGDNDADAQTHTVMSRGNEQAETLHADQVAAINSLASAVGVDVAVISKFYRVRSLDDVPAAYYESIMRSLEKKRKPTEQAQTAEN
jgi:hypothetical protein